MGFAYQPQKRERRSRRAPGPRDRWLPRQVRGLRPDRNPLRRRIDRAEIYLLGGLFVAAVAATPLAAQAASRAAYENALRTQQEQQATRHPVQAVLTAPARDDTLSALVPALATWTSVTGKHRSGVVLAQTGSPKGTKVPVWTDQAGDLTWPPLATSQVVGQGDAAMVGAIAGVVVMAVGAGGAIHYLCYRRRLAAWDADWLVTARTWNHQSW